jgi:hypothetical protein
MDSSGGILVILERKTRAPVQIIAMGAVLAALVWPSSAAADGGILMNPGPCNSLSLFTDTDELQDDIFDHFEIHPDSSIGTVLAEGIDTFIAQRLRTRNVRCSSAGDSTEAPGIDVRHAPEPSEEIAMRRFGPIRDAETGLPAGKALVLGRLYRFKAGPAIRRGHRWKRIRKANLMTVQFRVRCRIMVDGLCVT